MFNWKRQGIHSIRTYEQNGYPHGEPQLGGEELGNCSFNEPLSSQNPSRSPEREEIQNVSSTDEDDEE